MASNLLPLELERRLDTLPTEAPRRGYIDRASVPNGEWGTPPELFERCEDIWGEFTLDPAMNCGQHETYYDNRLLAFHYCGMCGRDGLVLPWASERVFLNPPYDKTLPLWVARCAGRAALFTCALLPIRTGRPWWQKHVLTADAVVYLPGRLKFVGAENSAPFDSCLVLWWQAPKR